MRIVKYFKSLMLVAMALTVATMTAANVDSRAAQAKAIQFMNSQPGARFMASTATMKLTHAEASKVKAQANDYYVFNMDGGGFVIVSGDDRAEEILAYGNHFFDVNNLPVNVAWWLGTYKEQIEFLFEHPDLEVETPSELMSGMLRATSVPQLMSSTWDQEAPYYNQCPTYQGSYCMTGCVATAMAQVMYFWKYPNQLPALDAYTTSETPRFDVSALPGTTLDWNNMKDHYGTYYDANGNQQTSSYTTAQGNAVATLMRYCGQAVEMMYSPDGSGAYTTDQRDAMLAFGYNSGAKVYERDNYSASNWNSMMQADLQAGRPIMYGGNDLWAGGHAFVVDGYNASTSKYHVNFGWSGYDDAYYALDAFSGSGYTFSYYQDMIIGVYPEGSTLETYSAEMGAASNVTSTSFKASWSDQTPSENVTDYTLYVQAYNANTLLTETFGGITVMNDGTSSIENSLDNYCDNTGWTGTYVYQGAGGTAKLGSSNYAGTLTTPALDLSTSGGTITVTFNARSYGTDGSSVIVSCGNASETVDLTNSAADYTVRLSGVSATAGQKVTFANTAKKKRLYLDNIEISAGSAKLNASETGDANNRVITGITSKNYTVNNLTPGGSYKFYVVTNFTDGSTKESNIQTVTLEGSSVPTPEIVVDPETLTMNANVGETATATFDVLGADLNGNVTLTLSDASGVFSINPATISKANAEAGATVTVTYAPTAAGEHNATVTVSSEGADPVTVTLNGTSALQTTAPVMAAATNVGTTSFTATWTDATAAQYVTDYTLYVNKVGAAGIALLTETFDKIDVTKDGTIDRASDLDEYCDNAGWTGNAVYEAVDGGIKLGSGTKLGYVTTPALDLTNCGGTITVLLNAKSYGNDATSITVSCGDVSETVALTTEAVDYTIVLTGVPAAAGQQVTISSVAAGKRLYIYNAAVYAGEGAGDSRVITGITAKTYTVEGLTAGETYEFYVVANYTDGTNAASNHEQVTLQGAAPTPELIVDPETLTMTANVGETATATFDVLGADLTGNVTVTLNDETGFFSIDPATISVADAEEGATITVTYTPTALGEHEATITVASQGAEAVTVTLNGTAAMPTTAPVMAAATNVGTTSFTATWTDATAAQYVTDYTLYVNKVGGAGIALLTETFDKIDVTKDGTIDRASDLDEYCDNAGWTGNAVYEAVDGGIKLGSGTKLGYVTTPALDLTNCGGTITVLLNAKSYGNDATSITVSCGDVSETVALTTEAVDYTIVLTGVPAAAGQQVTISSVAAGKRLYIYNAAVYAGEGAGDSRVITGITAKTYTVEGLTAGETYEFYVVANYTDGTNAASNHEQVTLEASAPGPEMIVGDEEMTMAAAVLETATASIEMLASNLTADVTVTLTDETGFFSIDPATISVADAEEGAIITVTYAPTSAGEHTATVTLSSEGAEDVTVTITATAAMDTLEPEMQPADEEYVTSTSFRADWLDITPEQYVTSYTLYVNKKQEIPAGTTLLTETFGGTEDAPTSDSNYDMGENGSLDDNLDNAGWTGYAVYLASGGGVKLGSGTKIGTLTTPALDLTNSGGTVTVKFNAKSYGSDGSSIIVSCGEVTDTVALTTEAADYTVVLTGVPAEAGQQVTLSGIAIKKRFYLNSVTIIGGVETAAKAITETGDADSRVITGITDQYYVVENLTPGATYTYYVEANYIDNTKAASNVETVTLLEEQGHGYALGDVNHDGFVRINDVTALIDYLLSGNTGTSACPICADVNQDTKITISDVTALIDLLLSSN